MKQFYIQHPEAVGWIAVGVAVVLLVWWLARGKG
jgi:hypothetical protein